jgi:hypothetical protein
MEEVHEWRMKEEGLVGQEEGLLVEGAVGEVLRVRPVGCLGA